MAGVSEYERSLIRALLAPRADRAIERGVGLYLTPVGETATLVTDAAVLPAMRVNRLSVRDFSVAFDDTAVLSDVCRWIQIAEVIIADLSDLNPPLMYVLGLCHGLGRCPILTVRSGTMPLPFNVAALRCEVYATDQRGLVALRENLVRRIRLMLSAPPGPPPSPPA